MRSWTKIVMSVAALAAAGLPGAARAQQADPKPGVDSVAPRPAAADTGTARKASADSTGQRPVVADTGTTRKASTDGEARNPVVADTGTARKAAADSMAADTGRARRVTADSRLLGEPAPMEQGLLKRPNPLGEFTRSQTQYARVFAARLEKRFEIKKLYRERGIEYPAAEVFVRIFKRERELELWVRPAEDEQFSLLKTYSICALAGELGPKRTEGDGQTPEGFYFIDWFNPTSDYHLSLHLDYPNRADRALWKSPNPGGEIFIHGGCNSAGCMAVTDDAIKEIYWIAVEARSAGQRRIPVHIFPTRLTDNALTQLVRVYEDQPEFAYFWSNLKTGFDYFEEHRKVPGFSVSATGRYALKNQMLGEPVADKGSGGGLLGRELTTDSVKPNVVAGDSIARRPVSNKPIVPDSTRRGGD